MGIYIFTRIHRHVISSPGCYCGSMQLASCSTFVCASEAILTFEVYCRFQLRGASVPSTLRISFSRFELIHNCNHIAYKLTCNHAILCVRKRSFIHDRDAQPGKVLRKLVMNT